MDTKEALRYFNFVVTLGRAYYPNSEAFKAHELAVEALEKVPTLEAENARLREKETPKEPIMKEGNNRDLFCSICGARVSDVADRIINSDNLQKYCGVCGQLLDWSSDKE